MEQALRRFDLVSLVSPDLAVRAAKHDRFLRGKGIAMRKTIDLRIGAFCIAHRHALLHADRDFAPMKAHLGLRVVEA